MKTLLPSSRRATGEIIKTVWTTTCLGKTYATAIERGRVTDVLEWHQLKTAKQALFLPQCRA
ncbi:MAG: hypothetical protein PsegKO_35950 [Pseudohongiellaceae bacterium]